MLRFSGKVKDFDAFMKSLIERFGAKATIFEIITQLRKEKQNADL